MKKMDLTGQKFSKLTVISETESNKHGKSCWLCKCECGKLITVIGVHLRSGHTTSCGCSSPFKITHGGTTERLYSIWCAMKKRCYNTNTSNYKDYGGRGITVCNEWLNDYLTFRNWALANGYRDNLSIDRKDVNGNYEPSNCRWASKKIQANNIRQNHLLTFNGITKTMSEWADSIGINYQTLASRINKFNWSIEKALTIPAAKRGKQC